MGVGGYDLFLTECCDLCLAGCGWVWMNVTFLTGCGRLWVSATFF